MKIMELLSKDAVSIELKATDKEGILSELVDLLVSSGNVKKTEQAKMVGKKVAEEAKKKGIEQVVFDRGGYLYHGRIKALADAAREGGLKF